MPGAGAIIAMLIGASTATLLPASEIRVADGSVRVGDLVRLDGVAPALRDRIARRVVAAFPPGRDRIILSRPALAALVRRALPGLVVGGDGGGPITLRSDLESRPSGGSGEGCFATARPVAGGEILVPADAVPAPCHARDAVAAIAFDPRQSVTRAAADLPAGAYLGRIRLSEPPGVARGDTLTLAAIAGPVRIERRVVALQPGRPGGRLFVRTDDGEVIAAALPEAEAETVE